MRLIDLILAFFCSLLLGVVIASPANAGGSISREDFLSEITDPAVRDFVLRSFKLAEDGLANRIGGSDPENAGKRVGPFEIVARTPSGHERVVIHVGDRPDDPVRVLSCAESTHFAPHCFD